MLNFLQQLTSRAKALDNTYLAKIHKILVVLTVGIVSFVLLLALGRHLP